MSKHIHRICVVTISICYLLISFTIVPTASATTLNAREIVVIPEERPGGESQFILITPSFRPTSAGRYKFRCILDYYDDIFEESEDNSRSIYFTVR